MSSVFKFKDCILNAGMERLDSKHFLYSTVMHESVKLWTCKNKPITQGSIAEDPKENVSFFPDYWKT